MRTVVINDLLTDRKSIVVFGTDDFDRAERYWEEEDKILIDLQDNEVFKGKTRWCDLNPTQFRIMLIKNLALLTKMGDEEQADGENVVVASLTFLLTSFIKCLETRTESMVELMHVNMVTETDVLFDYTASLNMHLDLPKKPQGGLRVVVDNS